MTVLIIETNLIWSIRLAKSVRALGHDVTIIPNCELTSEADVAILNLSSPSIESDISILKSKGITTIAHAGHKEKEKMEFGRIAGVNRIVSNSELTFKLESILSELAVER